MRLQSRVFQREDFATTCMGRPKPPPGNVPKLELGKMGGDSSPASSGGVGEVYKRWGIDAAVPITLAQLSKMNEALADIQNKMLQSRSRPNTPRTKDATPSPGVAEAAPGPSPGRHRRENKVFRADAEVLTAREHSVTPKVVWLR